MIYYWEGALLFAAEFRLTMTRSARDRLATSSLSCIHSDWLQSFLLLNIQKHLKHRTIQESKNGLKTLQICPNDSETNSKSLCQKVYFWRAPCFAAWKSTAAAALQFASLSRIHSDWLQSFVAVGYHHMRNPTIS